MPRQRAGDGGSKAIGAESIVPTQIAMDAISESMEHQKMLKATRNKLFARLTDAHTMKRKQTMKTFEFSIIASGLDPHADDFEDRFYDSGCDDALVAFQKGHIIVDFAREANSIEEAISSAIANVQATGASIDRVEPDPLVNLSEIADRIGTSRSAISHYAKGTRGRDFPPPVAKVTDESPLWSWAAVARWFVAREQLTKEALVEAEVVREANEAIAQHDTRLLERLKKTADLCRAA
jgi:predicted DNA-binding transcriptional regulator AlpA